MKKILALLLALVMLLCACGNDPEPAAGETEKTTAPSEETTAPSEETTAPSEETTAPSEETTAPSEESTAPSEETTAPSEETTAPSEETTAPSEESTAPSEETDPTLPSHSTTEIHVLAGLSYTLTGNFEEVYRDETGVSYMSENLSVDVGFGAMEDVDGTIADSAAFAQYFYDGLLGLFEDAFDEAIMDERNGVSYILLHNEAEPQTVVVGFYVCGEVGWTVGVSGFEPDLDVENMIDMATSGIIDETAIPELPEPVDPEDAEPMEQTFCGLIFMLDTSFELVYEETYYASYYNPVIGVDVSFELLTNIEVPVTNSQEYAEYFATNLGDTMGESSMGVAGDVSYLILRPEEYEMTVVYGFYVSGDYGWMIYTCGEQEDLEDQLIAIATSGVIDESAIPEIEISELPEPSDTISFQGLSLTLPGIATPTYVDLFFLDFNYEGMDFSICFGEQDELDYLATGADLAAQQQNMYESIWEKTTVDSRNGVDYVLCQDSDGVAMVIACYVSEENWWTVSSMDYFDDVDTVIDLVTAATID